MFYSSVKITNAKYTGETIKATRIASIITARSNNLCEHLVSELQSIDA